jgi:serine/threonine protein kinase
MSATNNHADGTSGTTPFSPVSENMANNTATVFDTTTAAEMTDTHFTDTTAAPMVTAAAAAVSAAAVPYARNSSIKALATVCGILDMMDQLQQSREESLDETDSTISAATLRGAKRAASYDALPSRGAKRTAAFTSASAASPSPSPSPSLANVSMPTMERYGNFVVKPESIPGTLFRHGVMHGSPGQPPRVILARVFKKQEEAAVYELLRRLPHPHAASVICDHIITANEEAPVRLIVLPAAGGQNLAMALSGRVPMPLQAALHTLVQVAAAVAHCHEHGVVLRDLTIGKIFYTDAQRKMAVLADLSGAQVVHSNPTRPGLAWVTDSYGSHAYLAPEVIRNQGYDACAADVYALGIVFFVTLTARFPFFGTLEQIHARIMANSVEWPQNITQAALTLLKRMLHINPAARPTAAAILSMPWLTGIVSKTGVPMPMAPMSAVAPAVSL